MELSLQNATFLSFLHKLDIDVNQFPEKTFDGLFENVPELNDYFFNWFVENVTPDNVLTQSEQATYFQLVSSQSLCSQEEINHVLSSCSPTFEEVMSLDVNYVNYLSEDLDDLKKSIGELSTIVNNIERSYNDVKKKQNNLKEVLSARKKCLSNVKEDCVDVNLSFGNKLEEVKLLLLEEPRLMVDFDLFYDSLPKEGNGPNEFEIDKLLGNEVFNSSNLDFLKVLEEDLNCAEISLILSEGFLKLKREKIDSLTKLSQSKPMQRNVTSFMLPNGGVDPKMGEEIKVLESELFEKVKVLSHCEVQKISDEYFHNKLELNRLCIDKLTSYQKFIESDLKINLCLLHILLRSRNCLEYATGLRDRLHKKLIECETNFSKDVTSFELQRQRFKEVMSQQSQHPVLSAVENVMNIEGDPESNEETFKKLIEVMSYACDDANFISCGPRNDLQSAIKSLLDKTLCGPTSQLLFVPVELLIKMQDCEQWENKLSHIIKRLVNKYVEAKASVSRSDRKVLLLWIDFLTNPVAFKTKINQSSQSKNL